MLRQFGRPKTVLVTQNKFMTAAVSTTLETSLRYRVISAGLAFVSWGGWAYFVNSQSVSVGQASPVVSAAIHGCGSALVTLVMVAAVTRLVNRLFRHPLRTVLPSALTTATTGSCMTTAHILAGTANVPATVVPGLVVAFCFNLITTRKLLQKSDEKALTDSSC